RWPPFSTLFPYTTLFRSPRGVVAYYGANDGMLHAIDGAQTGSSAGQQLWAFVPEEGLPKLKRLRDNLPNIRFSTTPDTLTEPKRSEEHTSELQSRENLVC